jgi:hypothetical protein
MIRFSVVRRLPTSHLQTRILLRPRMPIYTEALAESEAHNESTCFYSVSRCFGYWIEHPTPRVDARDNR